MLLFNEYCTFTKNIIIKKNVECGGLQRASQPDIKSKPWDKKASYLSLSISDRHDPDYLMIRVFL